MGCSSAPKQHGFDGAVATFNAVTAYTGTIDSGASPFTTIQNPFPGGLREPEGNEKGSRRYGITDHLDQNRVNPYNQQWQVSIQRSPGASCRGGLCGHAQPETVGGFNLNENRPVLALGADETKK
jgi:hypothetical protein